MTFRICAAALASAVLALGLPARAEEGMWTFEDFPAAKVKQTLGVEIGQDWLDRIKAATVRLTEGCSGAVVSKDGLVLTNAHCVLECAQALSTAEVDHVHDGFLTEARSEERFCPGQQAEILLESADIGPKVAAATAGKSGQAFVRARDGAMTAAEQAACRGERHLRCQAVPLYDGGEYRLYTFRKYEDVRLVFAAEYGAAFFGGDPDNFTFPRFNFDVAFLRLYEGGKPARTPEPLAWTNRPPREGEPVFVPGNPGSTARQLTLAQLETERDLILPVELLQAAELRGRLIRFSQESPERKRLATDALTMLENDLKVGAGLQLALTDRGFLAAKRKAEAELRAKVAADPALAAEIGDPWADIAAAQGAYASRYLPYRQMERGAGAASKLFLHARRLVRAARERARPDGERRAIYADARLALMEKQVLDPAPIDPELEKLYLAFWLAKTREYLSADDPAVRLALGRQSPEALAARLVGGTRLADPAVRRALWEGGSRAIEASDDPLIQYVRKLEPTAAGLRTAWEAEVAGPTQAAAERIGRARFAVLGHGAYPDATFTPRISYGRVAGAAWRGQTAPPFTTFQGLFERATGAEPYALTARWVAAEARLSPTTVLNFTASTDLTGGNSGSAAVDAAGEVLGVAFDGNQASLAGEIGYDGRANRAIMLSTAAIAEALDKVYGRAALIKELTGR